MKKLLTLLLLGAMLASTAACSGGGDDTKTTTANGDTSAADVETTEAAETNIPSNLPDDYDLEGYVMTYYGTKLEDGANNSETGVYTEEQNGETLNDAVYLRNKAVEEKYNCQIAYITCDSTWPASPAKPTILADDPAYDVILDGAQKMSSMGGEGLVVDLNTLEYMHTDSPWWLQTVNDTLSIGNRLYATIGSHMIRAKTFLFTTLFNYKLADDYGIDKSELFDAARNKTWTVDMLYNTAKLVKDDLNGDGAYDSNDLWGALGESYCGYTMVYGAGVDFVGKDDDDIPYIMELNEKNLNIITSVLGFMADTNTTLVTENIPGVDSVWTTARQMMTADKTLFFLGQPNISDARNMESDFGILPSPLYDESQEDYRHTTSLGNGTTMMIPISAKDPEIVGFISEALAYESYYSFLPEFYKNFLETKYARDDESVEMLQIIHDSIYYELSGVLLQGTFYSPIVAAAKGDGLESITSKLTSGLEAAETALATQLENLLK